MITLQVTKVAFSPTAQFIASVGGDDMHSVAVYDWQKQQIVFFANGHSEEVRRFHTRTYADVCCMTYADVC